MDYLRKVRQRTSRAKPLANICSDFNDEGDETYENQLFIEAATRAYEKLADQRKSDLQESALSFALKNIDALGLETIEEKLKFFDDDKASRQERRQILRNISETLSKMNRKKTNPSGLTLRLEYLSNLLELDAASRAVLAVAVRCQMVFLWKNLVCDIFSHRYEDKSEFIAALADISIADARHALTSKGPLRSKGLFQDRHDRDDFELSTLIRIFLNSSATSSDEMLRILMPSLSPSTLTSQNYGHMAQHIDSAARLLKHALETGERANLLIYGSPGTGKTELARLLADQLGVMAVSVGEADDDGDEPTRNERILHLTLSRKILEKSDRAILVIDEAEDLFISGIEKRGSKLWLNKLVEDGKGPHIWIVNNPELLGETVVRRMDMAIRFETPTAKARRAIIERLMQGNEATLIGDAGSHNQLVTDLTELNTSPAILTAAMRTGARIGEKPEGIVNLARDLVEASGRVALGEYETGETVFDPALSVADCDLVELANRLVFVNGNWSLLLSGPPGTGKSAFARYIAERSGVELLCKSGSDLLGMYVGETEKQIASAFISAERSGALLLIDEADSFLNNRDMAQRNWEVSMTNEILRNMERGRVRFIATTNRATMLDPASARRFVLHATFATLNVARARRLFELSFGMVAPVTLDGVDGLTPGDFAQMRQRAALLGERNPERLANLLIGAVNAREGAKERIGF